MPISTVNQKGLDAPLALTSPVLTTPNLGTPSALVLTNATGTPAAINLTNATALPKSALPTGSILQVQETTSTTPVTTSNTTYVNLFSVSITPSSVSNRILLMLGVPVYTQANAIPEMDVMRNGVTIVTFGFWQHINTGAYILSYPFNTHLDSPGTTSSITYTVRGRVRGGACTWVYQDGNGTMVGKITALEVAG